MIKNVPTGRWSRGWNLACEHNIAEMAARYAQNATNRRLPSETPRSYQNCPRPVWGAWLAHILKYKRSRYVSPPHRSPRSRVPLPLLWRFRFRFRCRLRDGVHERHRAARHRLATGCKPAERTASGTRGVGVDGGGRRDASSSISAARFSKYSQCFIQISANNQQF